VKLLPEVGQAGGETVDVLNGDDVDPSTGRLLSVAELQAALAIAESGALGPHLARALGQAGPKPGGTGPRPELARTSARHDAAPPTDALHDAAAEVRAASVVTVGGDIDAEPSAAWVTVLAAHAGAGSSTVALAVADAAAEAGRSVRLVECAQPKRSGLAEATTSELGLDRSGRWRRGRRGGVAIDRLADASAGDCGNVSPQLAPDVAYRDLTVVDAGSARGDGDVSALVGAGDVLQTAVVLLVCRATGPGVRQAERMLARLTQPVIVAAIGPAKWPGVVTASAGPLLRRARSEGQLVTIPPDRHLAVTGPTGAPLPRHLLTAGRNLLARLDAAAPGGGAKTSAHRAPRAKESNR
jgi:hypothetical protein